MSENPERTNAQSEARAELVCREVREDIVALQRDEVSPLRAESVRLHLASCAECREEALALELAIRDYAKLPRLAPPPDLVDITMGRVLHLHGEGEKSGASEKRGVAEARASLASRSRKVVLTAEVTEDTGNDVPEGDDVLRELRGENARVALAAAPVDGRAGVLHRPVDNPFVRVAVAALLLIAVMILGNVKVADAAGRVERGLLGAQLSDAVEEARDAFLRKLRL